LFKRYGINPVKTQIYILVYKSSTFLTNHGHHPACHMKEKTAWWLLCLVKTCSCYV